MRDPATDPLRRDALLVKYHVRWVLNVPGAASGPLVATGPQGQRLYAAF